MSHRVIFKLPNPRTLMGVDETKRPDEIKVVVFPAFWQLHKDPYSNWYCDDIPRKDKRGVFAGIPVVCVTYWEYIKFRICCVVRWIYGYDFSPDYFTWKR